MLLPDILNDDSYDVYFTLTVSDYKNVLKPELTP